MSRATLFPPVFATIMRERKLGSFICAAALLQLVLTFLRLPGWQCPIFHALGVPCPGCGLSRATLLLVQGHFKEALTMHAFAPLLIVALTVMTFCAIAPRKQTELLAAPTETFERYTGITILVLSGLILYWLVRLMIFPAAFVRLIQG
jgi:cellulose synthase/poly-beta-1,6-N-acetylglucosamine synthase-like glycosyltransferase